ncbi:MAG: 50S ribosomal protein L4 [Phycisphaerales bacterium]|nr:50S ribosomal protein L4 [Phycisphaerales bacterium]
MIDLPVLDKAGKQIDTLAIDETTLGSEVRPGLLKQAYVMYHANRRQGSARTKSRGMVEGSTRKLYRQKGTGNARVGNARTVIRTGGGVAFAKKRSGDDFRKKMPRGMRRLANRNALLAKLVDGEVKCIDSLAFDQPRTRDMKGVLDSIGIDRTCLLALDMENRNAALSSRNLADVDVIRIDQLNAFELLNHRYLVVERASLEAWLAAAGDDKEAA